MNKIVRDKGRAFCSTLNTRFKQTCYFHQGTDSLKGNKNNKLKTQQRSGGNLQQVPTCNRDAGDHCTHLPELGEKSPWQQRSRGEAVASPSHLWQDSTLPSDLSNPQDPHTIAHVISAGQLLFSCCMLPQLGHLTNLPLSLLTTTISPEPNPDRPWQCRKVWGVQWHETSYYRFFHAFLVAIAAFGSGHFSVLLLHVRKMEKKQNGEVPAQHISLAGGLFLRSFIPMVTHLPALLSIKTLSQYLSMGIFTFYRFRNPW